MSNPNYEEPILEEFVESNEEATETETEVTEPIKTYGVVIDCLRLNIRTEPDKEADVATIVTCLDEVEVDLDASTDEWYAVCTVTGIEGFCMKKFIAIRQ